MSAEQLPEPTTEFKVGPLSAKGSRSLSALDRLLARPIEGLENYLNNRRDANIKDHIDAVSQNLENNIGDATSPAQFTMFEKWTVGASEYGNETPEMSAAWRAALDAIVRNNIYSQDINNFLEKTPPSIIHEFVNSRYISDERFSPDSRILVQILPQDADGLDGRSRSILIDSGIIEVSTLYRYLFTVITFTSCISIFGLAFVSYRNNIADIKEYLKTGVSSIILSVLLIVVTPYAYLSILRMVGTRYRLTRLGTEFMKQFRRYRGT